MRMSQHPSKRRIRCPRCGMQPCYLIEVWTNHSIEFEYDQDLIDREGILQEGEPKYVAARCECGHGWRLHGVSQITDLCE